MHAITVPIDDDLLSWRVDPENHEIVGLEIEFFVAEFLQKHIEFSQLAGFLGVPEDVLAKAREGISPERYQLAAIDSMLDILESSTSS